MLSSLILIAMLAVIVVTDSSAAAD